MSSAMTESDSINRKALGNPGDEVIHRLAQQIKINKNPFRYANKERQVDQHRVQQQQQQLKFNCNKRRAGNQAAQKSKPEMVELANKPILGLLNQKSLSRITKGGFKPNGLKTVSANDVSKLIAGDPRSVAAYQFLKNPSSNSVSPTQRNLLKYWGYEDLVGKKEGKLQQQQSGSEEQRPLSPPATVVNYLRTEISVTGCSLNEREQKKKASPPPAMLSDINLNAAKSSSSVKRPSCLFKNITPNNVDQEKEKFFKANFNYDPQFTYDFLPDEKKLLNYNDPSDQYMAQAIAIMEQVLFRYGSYQKFEAATGGQQLTRNILWIAIKNYLKKEGFLGNVCINLDEGLLSRGSMTVCDGKPTLNIRPSTARSLWLEGLLRHEIGTHHIRFCNNRLQPWHNSKIRRKLGMKGANPTEEGLASLHSVLLRRDPSLWRAAFLYYACYKAKFLSFSQLFRDLRQFTDDPEVRWDYCLRTKRGREDTSRPGGFCKDQVYLNGIIPLLRHRNSLDFEALVRLGKVSWEDVDRLSKFDAAMDGDQWRLPHFMANMDEYRYHLDRIVEVNRLQQWLDVQSSPRTSARLSTYNMLSHKALSDVLKTTSAVKNSKSSSRNEASNEKKTTSTHYHTPQIVVAAQLDSNNK